MPLYEVVAMGRLHTLGYGTYMATMEPPSLWPSSIMLHLVTRLTAFEEKHGGFGDCGNLGANHDLEVMLHSWLERLGGVGLTI